MNTRYLEGNNGNHVPIGIIHQRVKEGSVFYPSIGRTKLLHSVNDHGMRQPALWIYS